MAREFTRSSRLSGQIQRVLNELLRFEVKDPRLSGVTVSDVDLSRDLSVARVFFATLTPDADPEPVLAALEKASGFLRGRLGREIKVRHVPELRFAHDDSVARGFHLSELIANSGSRETTTPESSEDDD
ncbi:MAG: 30S ribosome-binding factor RbfA [Pseudomonadota bacterium]